MNTLCFPNSRCQAGVAVADITPPVGIYHRMWGAATHDQSTGVHRPLAATALVLSPLSDSSGKPQAVFLAVDHCLLWHKEMDALLRQVSDTADIDEEQLVVFFSHTHAAGLMGLERAGLPGGDLIPGYLQDLSSTLSQLISKASANMQQANIAYGSGRCGLARNRDYFDPSRQAYVCGFNPEGPADDLVMVGHVTSVQGETLATVVNYACHPTTLAWENSLISPDYVGAMRETVSRQTEAPCFFIQGASGDLGPRDGYVGDVSVADRNGRQLGYAVLSALEQLPPAGMQMCYAGAVLSGATLGTWKFEEPEQRRVEEFARWNCRRATIELPLQDELPDRDHLLAESERWQRAEAEANVNGDEQAARDARAMLERCTRRLTRIGHLPDGDSFTYPLRLWQLGDAVWVALDGEHYHVLQQRLRAEFPDVPLVVGTLANGSDVWYLPDADSYGKGLYQEEASVLARGSLEKLGDALVQQISQLLETSGS